MAMALRRAVRSNLIKQRSRFRWG